MDVNLRIKEMIRLLIAAKRKMKMRPYNTAVPKLLDSIFVLPFPMPFRKNPSV
jgi:hypothetical protein